MRQVISVGEDPGRGVFPSLSEDGSELINESESVNGCLVCRRQGLQGVGAPLVRRPSGWYTGREFPAAETVVSILQFGLLWRRFGWAEKSGVRFGALF